CMRLASWRWLRCRARRMSRTWAATRRPASASAGIGLLVTNCGARRVGSSASRGLWHFLQRELFVRYCMSLQYSHRTTSRVSTLTKVVAIGCCGVPEQGTPGAVFAPIGVTLGYGTIIVK